ncbi:hypothetical protein ROS9278_01042 [Roseomonas sp. CECT 9278]|nr:hypothetical protein ROS9278_01042 [Roseomonas sp. CECT 9278]
MLLSPDRPAGRPPFSLYDDEVATVVDLVCRGAAEARGHLQAGMIEVPITRLVRKGIRRVKQGANLSNVQLRAGELELDDMASTDPTVLGRIDITLQFVHQFGEEDAYVAIECKRVGARQHQLNARYVTDGVERFVTGQYALGHSDSFMLGFVLVLPAEAAVASISGRVRSTYGEEAQLILESAHPASLAVLSGRLLQKGSHAMRLHHIFVDMTPAA